MSFGKLRSPGHSTTVGRTGTPGPGSYEPQLRTRKRAADMGRRPPSAKLDAVPGPCDYEPSSVKQHLPHHNFGYGTNHEGPKTIGGPSPGAYDNSSPSRSPLPARDFGIGRGFNASDTPGPGEYNAEQIGGNVGAARIGDPRRELFSLSSVVGPGTYDNMPTDSSISRSFGKAVNHEGPAVVSGPGPAEYEVSKSTKETIPLPARDFGIGRVGAVSSGPGPGEYDAERIDGHNRIARIGDPRRELFSSSTVPGPGAYDGSSPSTSTWTTFGRAANHEGPAVIEGPGPGNYDVLSSNDSTIPLPARDFGIGRGVFDGSTSPGPGEYNAEGISGHTRTARVGDPRQELFRVSSVVGPGTYDGKLPDSPTGARFGRAANHEGPPVSPGPGPAEYNPPAMFPSAPLPAQGFGLGHEFQPPDGPGPGSYDGAPVRGNTQSAKLNMSRSPLFSISSSPGPGEYQSDREIASLRNPGFGTTAAHEGPRVVSGPGPGTYALESHVSDRDGRVGIGMTSVGAM